MNRLTATGLPEREFNAIKAFLLAATVPLVYESGEVAGIQGTGCLFDLSGVLYFVTAGHVLEKVDPCKLGVPIRQHDSAIFTLGSGIVGWSRQDAYDVAAYRIDDAEIASTLRDAYIVLSSRNVTNATSGNDHFIISGYPIATVPRVGNTLTPKDLTQVHTTRYDGKVLEPPTEFDLFFNLGRTAASLWNQRVEVPDLRGISGAPVWQVHESTSVVWTPESSLCLVGIQVACDPKGEKYIRALAWPVVLAALQKLAPGQ